MRWFLTTVWQGLMTNGARTSENAEVPELRGRCYAIPFDRVWHTALGLIDGGLPRWELISEDDYDGVIDARVGAAFLHPETSLMIHIGLGENAETRVEVEANAPDRKGDLGSSIRSTTLFLTALDAALAGSKRAIAS